MKTIMIYLIGLALTIGVVYVWLQFPPLTQHRICVLFIGTVCGVATSIVARAYRD